MTTSFFWEKIRIPRSRFCFMLSLKSTTAKFPLFKIFFFLLFWSTKRNRSYDVWYRQLSFERRQLPHWEQLSLNDNVSRSYGPICTAGHQWVHSSELILVTRSSLPLKDPSFFWGYEHVREATCHLLFRPRQKKSCWGKLILKMNMKRAIAVKRTPMIVFICYCIATTFFTLLATNDVSWLVQHTIRHTTLILWPFSLKKYQKYQFG